MRERRTARTTTRSWASRRARPSPTSSPHIASSPCSGTPTRIPTTARRLRPSSVTWPRPTRSYRTTRAARSTTPRGPALGTASALATIASARDRRAKHLRRSGARTTCSRSSSARRTPSPTSTRSSSRWAPHEAPRTEGTRSSAEAAASPASRGRRSRAAARRRSRLRRPPRRRPGARRGRRRCTRRRGPTARRRGARRSRRRCAGGRRGASSARTPMARSLLRAARSTSTGEEEQHRPRLLTVGGVDVRRERESGWASSEGRRVSSPRGPPH
mmetsp:Transcript_19281/g.76771  ORF Transcript_19281/g.76771 Transcript_19281/m.76771 type:complete len:273 (-) Transcript_19281:32-850(-)